MTEESDERAIQLAMESLQSHQPLAGGDIDLAQAEAAGKWWRKAKAIFIWKNGRPVGIDAQQRDIWGKRARDGDDEARDVVLGAEAYRLRFGRGGEAAAIAAEALVKSIPVDPARRRQLKNADRDVAVAQAVLEVTALGYRPTRNVGSRDNGRGHCACSIVVEALARLKDQNRGEWQIMSEDAVEKVWKSSGMTSL